MRVYAAGSMGGVEGKVGGEWRKKLPHIENLDWVLPIASPGLAKGRETQANYFIAADITCLNSCDLMLAVFEVGKWNGGTVPMHGTCTEVGIAHASGIPIIGVCPDEEAAETYKFPLKLIPTVVNSLDEAVDIIRFVAKQSKL